MKPRTSRIVGDQTPHYYTRSEAPTVVNPPPPRPQVQIANQPSSNQSIRKRRSSINVYDQPSSLNSRLRQLETDMIRLDEDRSKLYDDTHSQLTQYDLKLSEIQSIIKSRQDNVEKYVEDMRTLLQAREELERQTKLLNERYERIHEKFMHRETTVSREIKLLKNKFELLEKNRHFKSILQKSNNHLNSTLNSEDGSGENSHNSESEIANDEGNGKSNPDKADQGFSSKSQTATNRACFGFVRSNAMEKLLLRPIRAIKDTILFRRARNKVSSVSIVEPSSKMDLSRLDENSVAGQKYVDEIELEQTKQDGEVINPDTK